MEKGRILEVAMGGIYLLSGLSKLLPIPSMVEQFDQFAEHFPFGLKPPGWLFLRRYKRMKLLTIGITVSRCTSAFNTLYSFLCILFFFQHWRC